MVRWFLYYARAALALCLVNTCLVDGWMVGGTDKLLLTIYYESNCPDSKSFILNQLVPAAELLQDHLMLQFIPFGKSKSYPGGFVCQHGPAECLGNVVQDCALHSSLATSSDFDRLRYVACEMSREAGSRGSLQCVQSAGLPLYQVQQCVSSSMGTELQLKSEHLTNLVRPQFVPTVTVNGIFNQNFQDSAQNDLVGTLCPMLPENKGCAEYYNSLALKHLMRSTISFDQFF